MRFFFISIILHSLLFSTVQANEDVGNITIVNATADNWCPYTCMDDIKNRGLLIDILEAAFEEQDIELNYSYKSWSRSVQNVKSGTSDILIGAISKQKKDFYIAFDFFTPDETVFAIRKDSNIIIKEGKDLNKYKIAHVIDYEYDDSGLWQPFIDNHQNKVVISSTMGERHLLTLLQRNRIDLAVINNKVASYNLQDMDHKENIELLHRGISSNIYLAFTISERGEKIRALFQKGFKRLIGTEKLQTIYTKYQVQMPDFK
ncbi:MAG: polar amino acid transport system substrate-binding protein [Enterobacterales bacterium]|jgi:polar amino acid transport system substrate-binding protein